jgi:aminopeptidase YwaD
MKIATLRTRHSTTMTSPNRSALRLARLFRLACAFACLALVTTISLTQEREDRTLLNWDQMRAIINEASGDRAMHHVLELVPYPRVRDREEYGAGTNHFRESEVMMRFAKEYGYSNVETESFESGGRDWQAWQGELWEVKPNLSKIYDIHDVHISLMNNSETGDVTADLIDVGNGGRAEDYTGKDVKGKIVLGSAGGNALQRLAVFEHGAVGVMSYSVMYPEGYSDIGVWSSIAGAAPQGAANSKPGFGWEVSPRVGRELAARLNRGEKITLRSVVKSETFPGEMEVVHATIPGDGSSNQDVIVSGHLYEGYIKQGANDDNSGCALTLEVGRTYIRLVQQGLLPKPRRTIHFLWVPEISGTNAWLNKHKDIEKRLIADLNFDMEGLGLARGGSFWTLHRTPDSFPSFLNDLAQSTLEFVGNLNRERLRYRANGYKFTLPVISPNGSRDPFYFLVEKYYGSSDHATYMQHGIPAIIYSTWPDPWYHSSGDTPDKLDPTQFKRAAVVATADMTILATAEDTMAQRVVAESLARGAERMGQSLRKGLAYIADAGDAAALDVSHKDAHNAVAHQAGVEKDVIRTAVVLFNNQEAAKKQLEILAASIDARAGALQTEVANIYKQKAAIMGVPDKAPELTAVEKEAARTYPERVGGAGGRGGFGGGGGGGRGGRGGANPELAAAMARIPGHMTGELNAMVPKGKSVLEIRNFISGEFEPVPTADVLEYFRAMEKAGTMKLTVKPEEPPKPVEPAKPVKKGSVKK